MTRAWRENLASDDSSAKRTSNDAKIVDHRSAYRTREATINALNGRTEKPPLKVRHLMRDCSFLSKR
jgi:hypothetical protein